MVKIVFSTLAFVFLAAIASTLMMLASDRADSVELGAPVGTVITAPADRPADGTLVLRFEPASAPRDRG